MLDKTKPKRELSIEAVLLIVVIFLGVVIALLYGLGLGNQDAQPESPVQTSSKVKVIPVQGSALEPTKVSIVCVEGSAFLYVDRDVAYRGNPSLARFAEQDAACAK
jgi:hypothetical protein